MSGTKSGMAPEDVPIEVVRFLDSVPVFQMLEFNLFPEDRVTVEEWRESQEELMEVEPSSVDLRVLTRLPDGFMLSFDLRRGEDGYPLGFCDLGFAEEADPLGLTISEYLDLAMELAPLEAQMLEGVYPYEEIVEAFERRGLRENEFWAEFLAELAESRSSTEERMRYIRETR